MPDTTLTSAAIESVADLARQAAGKTVEIDGVTYSTTPLTDVRKKEPEPDALGVATLSSLVEYVKENRDDLELANATLVVRSPNLVALVGKLGTGHYRQRFIYLTAKCDPAAIAGFTFGEFLPLEPFNIALQALFEDAHQRADVLRLAGNVKADQVRVQADDGKTQTVEARAGVATVEKVDVPNPVQLAPFRTFTEVEQPASPFVFRLREGRNGIEAALFEADGGKWRETAVASIKAYLTDQLGGMSPSPIVIG